MELIPSILNLTLTTAVSKLFVSVKCCNKCVAFTQFNLHNFQFKLWTVQFWFRTANDRMCFIANGFRSNESVLVSNAFYRWQKPEIYTMESESNEQQFLRKSTNVHPPNPTQCRSSGNFRPHSSTQQFTVLLIFHTLFHNVRSLLKNMSILHNSKEQHRATLCVSILPVQQPVLPYAHSQMLFHFPRS